MRLAKSPFKIHREHEKNLKAGLAESKIVFKRAARGIRKDINVIFHIKVEAIRGAENRHSSPQAI